MLSAPFAGWEHLKDKQRQQKWALFGEKLETVGQAAFEQGQHKKWALFREYLERMIQMMVCGINVFAVELHSSRYNPV